jgi:hypothetical protein
LKLFLDNNLPPSLAKALLEQAEPAIRKAEQTGRGEAWSMKHTPNRRKYDFEKEKL